jgi:hypothetical protein
MDLDSFEMILVTIILAFVIIAAAAQVSVRTEYSEKALMRKIQYQQFLQQTDHRGVFADYRIVKEK